MPRERALNLEKKYGIGHNRYMELKYHCRQYEAKKGELRHIYQLSSSSGGRRSQAPSDPTASAAMRAAGLREYIDTIDACARETDPVIAPHLITSVTLGLSYGHINAKTVIPCGERQFKELRRKFYYLLSQKI